MRELTKKETAFLEHLSKTHKLEKKGLLALVEKVKDKPSRIENFLKIHDKKGDLVDQKLYPHHKKFFKYAKPVSYVVKGRQIWFTTTVIADFYLDCVEKVGNKAIFINLDRKKTEAVFERAKTMQANFPFKNKLKKDTGDTLIFSGTDSSFSAITAKNDMGERAAKEFGRSLTAQCIHISEAPYIVHLQHMLDGLFGSLPKDGKSRVILEGTGAGASGEFYNRCMMVKDNGTMVAPNVWHFGGQSYHFIPWFEHLEYRLDYDPFEKVHIPEVALQKWMDYEPEHRKEMDKYDDMDEEEKTKAMWFLRYIALNEYSLVDSPDRSISITGQEYPATDAHAFQSTGTSYLSSTRIEQLSQKWRDYNTSSVYAPLPIAGRLFHEVGETPTFMADIRGDVQVFFPPERGWKNRYLVSADIGGGLVDGDSDYIAVRDRLKKLTVCVCHGHFGPKKTAALMLALGAWYDMALLAWENNNHGIGTTLELRRSSYPNLYAWHENPMNDLDFGWRTTEVTRRHGLEIFRSDFENQIDGWECPYSGFYKEARSFKSLPGRKDRPEGVGEHDDCVMGEMIASAVSGGMPAPVRTKKALVYGPGTVGHTIRVRSRTNRNKAYRNY